MGEGGYCTDPIPFDSFGEEGLKDTIVFTAKVVVHGGFMNLFIKRVKPLSS